MQQIATTKRDGDHHIGSANKPCVHQSKLAQRDNKNVNEQKRERGKSVDRIVKREKTAFQSRTEARPKERIMFQPLRIRPLLAKLPTAKTSSCRDLKKP